MGRVRPENRLKAALELSGSLSTPGPQNAGDLVREYFRARRYVGSHDRRWISEAIYTFLRHRRRLVWRANLWWKRTGAEPGAGLHPQHHDLPFFLLLAREGRIPDAPEAVYASALRLVGESSGEAATLRKLWETPDPPRNPGTRRLQDLAVTLSLPAWAAARLRQVYGREGTYLLGQAMLDPAPVDLRANTLKADRASVADRLEREAGIRAEPTPWSPWGLRIQGRVPLQGFPVFREGLFEVQDEGSQLVSLATGAHAGETVVDACAGGGGKTLALAAMMANSGRIFATDPDERRLTAIRKRCRRAGVTNASFLRIPRCGRLPGSLPEWADCVLVDAPCSGSGTWRRNLDLKDRYREAELRQMAITQDAILERFAVRVRPGGRLVYATCSLFREENEAVVDRFLKLNPGWTASIPEPFREMAGSEAWLDAAVTRLDPVRSGTDGFFIARLTRDE